MGFEQVKFSELTKNGFLGVLRLGTNQRQVRACNLMSRISVAGVDCCGEDYTLLVNQLTATHLSQYGHKKVVSVIRSSSKSVVAI